MASLKQGDREALGQLARRHQAFAFELAYRLLGERTAAEDVTQESFLRVWRAASRYEPAAQLRTWLYRIVVNLCRDEQKRRAPAIIADLPSPPVDQDSSLERDERAVAVRDAVMQLPERQRVVMILHRFAGLPLRQVGEATGWSESAVESLLVRAYAKLRQELKNV
jgi:RNA polymerase sigma-70 factor (ECF subfamily)